MNPRLFALVALLAAGCSDPPDSGTAIDHCRLREYIEECTATVLEPGELGACRGKALRESIRVMNGIPFDCKGPEL